MNSGHSSLEKIMLTMMKKNFKSAVNCKVFLIHLLLLSILVTSSEKTLAQIPHKSSIFIKKTVITNMPEKANFLTVVYHDKIYAFKYGPDHDIATDEDYKNAGNVFAYDPLTDKWESKALMPVKKVSYRIASLNDKIYVIGGFTSKDTPSNSVEMYDPATNTWSIKSNMPTARCRIGTAVLENKLFTFGGWAQGVETDAVEIYDPSDDTWAVKNSLPDKLMGVAVFSINGKIYYLRGVNSSWKFIYDFKEYSPTNDTWIKRAQWDFEREPEEPVIVNNRFFVLGGGAFTDSTVHSVKEYDFNSDRWILRKNMPAENMHTVHFSCVVSNGKIYTFGGGYRVNNEWRASNHAQVYDPSTDTWEKLEPLSEGKIGMAVEAIGNKIFVIGGEKMGPSGQSSQNEFSDKIEVYEIKEL